jgi:hypothetical protein
MGRWRYTLMLRYIYVPFHGGWLKSTTLVERGHRRAGSGG